MLFFLLLKRLTYKNSHKTKTNNNNLKTDNAKASKKVKTPPFTPSALAYCRPHSTPKFWDIWVKEKKTFINGLICVTFLEPAKPFSHSYNCGCKTSWITIMLVWPPTNQTSLATNQVVIGCEKLLQKVESISTFCNKICKSVKNL